MTNGSLTRDKRPGHNSPFGSPKSPSKIQPHFAFDSSKESKSAVYENVDVNSKVTLQNGDTPNNSRTTSDFVHEENEHKSNDRDPHPTTPNNQSSKWLNASGTADLNFSNSMSHAHSPNYENVRVENGAINVMESPVFTEKESLHSSVCDRAKSESPSIFGKTEFQN